MKIQAQALNAQYIGWWLTETGEQISSIAHYARASKDQSPVQILTATSNNWYKLDQEIEIQFAEPETKCGVKLYANGAIIAICGDLKPAGTYGFGIWHKSERGNQIIKWKDK